MLDPFLISGLYRGTLVEESKKNQPATRLIPDIPSIGNNKQHWLLLIRNEKEAYLNPEIFDMLNKLLLACKMTLDDVALVNMAHLNEADFDSLSHQFSPHKIILFGQVFPELVRGHHKNKIWETDGCYYLHTDDLEDMFRESKLKVPFWNELKELLKT